MCRLRQVLIVEDDAPIRALLATLLSEAGYTVRPAADRAAALALLSQFRPCMLLLDLRMAGLDGPAFLAAARRLPGPAPAVLVLSAEADGAQQAMALGAADFLGKPFDVEVLLATVGRHVAAHPAA